MRVAVLVTGTMNTFAHLKESGYTTIIDMLENLNIPYDIFIYTNEYAFFKNAPEEAIDLEKKEAHGYPIEKIQRHYHICRIGRERLEKEIAEVYSNVKKVTIQNEEDIYRNNLYLVGEKIRANYLQCQKYAQEHDLTYDAYIYTRPDAGIIHRSPKKQKKCLRLFNKMIHHVVKYPDEVYLASGDGDRLNVYPFCSVSQSHAYLGPEAMKVLADFPLEVQIDVDTVVHCKGCKKWYRSPERKKVKVCPYCESRKFKHQITEFRIYQHLFRRGIQMHRSEVVLGKLR